jgi:hypothetical protein
LPYPDNFRSTVSVFIPGQDKSRRGRKFATPIVSGRDAALSAIRLTEKDGGHEDVMRAQDRLYALNASQPAAMSFNAAS